VLKIRESVDGESVGDDFVAIPIGDSDGVDLGDEIRVLGYPTIGGSTITFTQGTVSGFTSEPGLDGRAWIKTDAAFSGGNSGGAAIGVNGTLIGIPTEVGSGAGGDLTDCRVIQDTNGDGSIDDADSCIPIGGFINGLRPVNLAADLIDEAGSGSPIAIPSYGDYLQESSSDISFTDLYFGLAVDESTDAVIDQVARVDSGASDELCLSWDFEGMANGLVFDVFWYADGELVEGASIFAQIWSLGRQGAAWSCLINYDGPVEDALYEVTVHVDGELLASSNVYVGDAFPARSLTMINSSDDAVCYVFISPIDALYWGYDQLGSTETVGGGDRRTWEVASAVYDLQARDCEGDVIDEVRIDATDDATYTYNN
jgi:serine protease Do